AFAISVLSSRVGSMPSACAACMPMLAASGSYSYSCSVKATPAFSSATVAGVPFAMAISVSVFGVDRIDRTAPRAVIFFEQLFRRRRPAGNGVTERLQIFRLVTAVAVDARAALQAGIGERETFAREVEQAAAADRRTEAEPRDLVPQRLPLLGARVLHHVPGGVETILVVEHADPERRQRRQSAPRPAVGTTHLEVTLEPHLRKDCGDMVRPVG